MAERYKIMVAFPGPSCLPAAYRSANHASQRHDFAVMGEAWGDNFENLWAHGLNLADKGVITHWAMHHADLVAEDWWADPILEEMDLHGAGMVSAHIAIKDGRNLCSCGVLDPADTWRELRRFTRKEMKAKPPGSYTAEDFGYAGYPLAHNDGLFVVDLRNPQWRTTNDQGELIAHFDFKRRIVWAEVKPGEFAWVPMKEPEDWYFSRMVHQLGIPSRLTNRVKVNHWGPCPWGNDDDNGREHDEDNADKWRKVAP